MRKKLELLAPAKNKEIARSAILHGADAVYIGASSHGARSEAKNSLAEIKETVDFAHQFGVKVYVTLNTIIFDEELKTVESLINRLYRIGVDALIIQDPAILKMDIPPINLHASTQCDIRTWEKAEFLKSVSFKRLILPRELTFKEIAEIRQSVPEIELEAFVHGALCVSYSGDCRASAILNGRSSNRGECAQICRLAYDLIDSRDNVLIEDKHLLSLKDLSRLNDLERMAEAGITTFKIEGRLKDENYVKNVVASYREALDKLIASKPEEYEKSSAGKISLSFKPDINKCFNRGFTTFFGNTHKPLSSLASVNTPKWIGEKIGTVISVPNHKELKIRLNNDIKLSNGDGVGFFDYRGKFIGFRANNIIGDSILTKERLEVLPQKNSALYRNRDVVWDKKLAGHSSRRQIDVTLELRRLPWGIALSAIDEDGTKAEMTAECQLESAKTPQQEKHKQTLQKTGDTIFNIKDLIDNIPEIFIPLSSLSDLRRNTLDELLRLRLIKHRSEPWRRLSQVNTTPPKLHSYNISTHENISNTLAKEFYEQCGAKSIEWGTEKLLKNNQTPPIDEPLMTCRYCIRREFNKCLKGANGNNWNQDLYLRAKYINGSGKSTYTKLKLKFDCANCRMLIFKDQQK